MKRSYRITITCEDTGKHTSKLAEFDSHDTTNVTIGFTVKEMARRVDGTEPEWAEREAEVVAAWAPMISGGE